MEWTGECHNESVIVYQMIATNGSMYSKWVIFLQLLSLLLWCVFYMTHVYFF